MLSTNKNIKINNKYQKTAVKAVWSNEIAQINMQTAR